MKLKILISQTENWVQPTQSSHKRSLRTNVAAFEREHKRLSKGDEGIHQTESSLHLEPMFAHEECGSAQECRISFNQMLL